MYHADPFDRLIVAQALMEPMRLITHDRILPRYSDSIIEI
jgi:PIN domain nuclease of toxin-antitoxin system